MYRIIGILVVWIVKRRIRNLPQKSQKKVLRKLKRNHRSLPWK